LEDGRNGPRETIFASCKAFEARLRQANPRLSAGRAARISEWLARDLGDGRVGLRVDPWQRNVLNHFVHQDEEFLSAWRCISAPVLWVTANDSETLRRLTDSWGGEAALLARMNHMPGLRRVCIPEAGHNLHHDQPEVLAPVMEHFLMDGTTSEAPPVRRRWWRGS
jgi:pimeloyl-ACP methyl ester carboxylesterase